MLQNNAGDGSDAINVNDAELDGCDLVRELIDLVSRLPLRDFEEVKANVLARLSRDVTAPCMPAQLCDSTEANRWDSDCRML